MGHPAPGNSDIPPAALEPSMLAVASVLLVLLLERQLILLGCIIGGVVVIVILWVLGSGIKSLIEWMRANAYTHTDEWRQERERVFWAERELAPPCKTVGHDEEDGRCIWCDKVMDIEALPQAEQMDELTKKVLSGFVVPTHHIDNLKPHINEDGMVVAVPIR